MDKTAETVNALDIEVIVCSCVHNTGRIALHEGHCCFREWDEHEAETYCHQEAIVALYPDALSVPVAAVS